MKKQRDDVKYLPEEIVMKILARLPVQSIVRFKLVCREWKSVTESAFFRNLYQSNDWSILHGNPRAEDSCLEQVKLDLPHEHDDASLSFASFFIQNKNMMMKEIRVVACTDGLVFLRLKSDEIPCYYIGNPVLSQWIQLPPPSPPLPWPFKDFTDLGLVTRMHNGALVGYKMIRIQRWCFDIFSSDTGEWSVTQVSYCPDLDGYMSNASNPVSLNGKLLWLDNYRNVIVHDFFSHQVQTICLPAPRIQGTLRRRYHTDDCCQPSPCQKIILTTSQGYCVLIDVDLINRVEGYNVRVWRLKSDCWNWERALEINMASVGLGFMCVPVAINYFDIHIIYLWDLDRTCFVACNLRTHSKSYGTRLQDGFVYKKVANRLCFEQRSCLSQFLPSLQLVPIY